MTLGGVCLAVATAGPALASERKPGVDPRQSGLDVAFVPDPPRSDLDRFRVHLGADLAGWIRQTPWPGAGPDVAGPRDDAAFLGYRRLGLHFGLGHGFADRFVVGVDFEYELTRGLSRTPTPADHQPKALSFGVLPYVEFMMVHKKLVRPFFMVRGGIGGSLVTTDGTSPVQGSQSGRFSLLHPTVGVGMGAHAFIAPEVSLDGMVTIDHRWEYARTRSLPNPGEADGTVDLAQQARHSAFGLRTHAALVLAVSRWF